jgi:hypothetical protein
VPQHLVFSVQPGAAGINPLSPQPVVQVIDANGNLDTLFNGSVTIALGDNPAGGTLSGGLLTQPVVGGVATFSGLQIDRAGRYTLVASSASPIAAAISVSFDIMLPTKVWVNLAYGPSKPNDGYFWGYNAFSTIQAAINAVATNGTLNIAAGTFVEQLNIGKDLTVVGQGAGTIIQSPANLPVNYNDYQAVVYIHDTANAVLQNLTVDGAARGDTYKRFVGVSFHHASGQALNLTVKNLKLSDPALFGMQTGYGIYADNRAGAAQCNVEVGGCVVTDCQKGGIYFAGDVVANAHDNKVVGAGPTGAIAQNGIVVLSGASGSVANNEVSGFAYTGSDADASGIVVYQAGATISGNLLPNNQAAVSVDSPTASMGAITRNSFEGSQTGVSCSGGGPVNAANNWWANVNGPGNASNPGGTGVAVSDNVVFSPWLGDGTDTGTAVGFQPNPAPVYYVPQHLVFSVQPGAAGINPLSPQPVVQVIDANGNLDTVFNGSVTIALGDNPAGGTLSGGLLIQPVVGGVATFSGLQIDRAGRYTLVASSDSPIVPASSESFAASSEGSGNTLPPVITNLPADVCTNANATVHFNVGVAGTTPFTYQWVKNGTNVLSDAGNITGATTSTLTLTGVVGDDSGTYVVIVSDPSGTVTRTPPASLAVLEHPLLSIAGCDGGSARLTVTWVPGSRVAVLGSTNLVDWVGIGTNTAPCTVIDTNAGACSHRFYRAAGLP